MQDLKSNVVTKESVVQALQKLIQNQSEKEKSQK